MVGWVCDVDAWVFDVVGTTVEVDGCDDVVMGGS